MKIILSCFFISISSIIFSQEIIVTSNFSKFYFTTENGIIELKSPSFLLPNFEKENAFTKNEYSSISLNLNLEKPKTFYMYDNFTGKHLKYSVSHTNFKPIQSFSNFYAFQQTCNLDNTNTKTTFADFGSHILSSFIAQKKFKLKEGCK
ncbi:hypothetical protein [Flavobacterium sp. UBA6135]|uniref:hypothetical protein n=1 Tax=Flavobacterium sp. UBA6135 TaxID=1946553 RepID=UPI0025C47908|nr:hypothetical protein [Flavobacterium sp. UBA6135]